MFQYIGNKYGVAVDLKGYNAERRIAEADATMNATEVEENQREGWMDKVSLMNPIDKLNATVNRKLSTIPRTTHKRVRHSDGTVIVKAIVERGRFKNAQHYPLKTIFGFLGEHITDSSSEEHMMEKLEKALGKSSFAKQIQEMLIDDPYFKSQLFRSLGGLTFKDYILVYKNKEDEFKTVSANRKTVNDILRDDLIKDFLSEDNTLFETKTN